MNICIVIGSSFKLCPQLPYLHLLLHHLFHSYHRSCFSSFLSWAIVVALDLMEFSEFLVITGLAERA